MFHHHPYHKGPIFGTVVKDELPLKPGRHNTPDLVERLLKRIDVVSPPSSKDKDVSEARADVSEAMSSLGAYVAIQTNDNDHRFELETFKGNEYNKFLMKLFEASKVIFSVNELPSTKVSEALGHEFPPADLIVHRITTNKLSRFAAEIKIRGKERSWDHIGALLGAMLELYFKYYGCDCIMCRQHDQGYGLGEGHAWQEIAHKLETSDILQVKIREFFPNSGPIDLFRKQLYIEELSYCRSLHCPVADYATVAK
ncbi:8ac1ec8c-57b0-488b-bf2d-9aa482594b3c-CDS [Sclerotinia trifoliorum]|uniref:8ac1ec8c-57b0-488b-bf2d-9aa482594b3c-CDS n=1 Tax=Sclerotinia trifoliorum TaxID=28548 RepID=A0A8H2VXT9_9HELO|nr:8ac1ec8c-57b0-488b-bf2d-9aa482594b3c-CDS [Sclerotinia trifoliorum]